MQSEAALQSVLVDVDSDERVEGDKGHRPLYVGLVHDDVLEMRRIALPHVSVGQDAGRFELK